ncbi:TPA: hypothetical protein ACHBLN_003032, partial [Enterococcus faecium]
NKIYSKDNLFFTLYLIYFLSTQYMLWNIDISQLIMIIYTPMMFIAFSRFHIDRYFYEKFTFSYILLMTFTYFYTRFFLNINNGLVINSCYYLLLTVPIVYLFVNPYRKNISFLLISIIILFSMKRTALITLALIIFIELILNVLNKKRISLRRLAFLIPFSLFIAALLIKINKIISSLYDNNIFMRFYSGDTIGESRGDILKLLLEKICTNSNIYFILLGQGINSTIYYTGGLTAHNDFLEVLFDFGIFGLLLYIMIYIIFIKKIRIITNVKDKRSLLYTMVILMLVSVSSHLIFIPSYVSLLIMNYNYLKNKNYFSKEN